MKEISVQELKEKREANEDFLLLDVREQHEFYISNIEGTLIPLGQLPQRIGEIEEYKDKEVVAICRSGARSAKAVELLEKEGFEDAKNLVGGINEWAKKIDPSLPVY